ncbi:Bax inhibitor-1/YccA family protein [Psittacicella hinzii]|uniref:Modulator of FtsH protease n=1 Tax=Psittacicella hinzii TaxID=2028575 RepID=A0A3A1YCL0_9GAMM|nr:Bax inhibitor-1 family protein [Psittacicella hinzii]RIY35106.1 hypothetical protein CKF58_07075 [Psittacicella hinzii]
MALNDITRAGSYTYYDVRSVVLRKAFTLLGVSVIAAIATGYLALLTNFVNPTFSLIAFIAVFAGSFIIPNLNDGPVGYSAVVITGGLLGVAIVPSVAFYIGMGGVGVVVNALVATAAIFISLAAYAVITKKDFTRIGGILTVALLAAVVVGLLNAFFIHSNIVSLGLAYLVALVSCGLILYRLSIAVNSGIMSVTQLAFGLLIDVYNLFTSLLRIFASRD